MKSAALFVVSFSLLFAGIFNASAGPFDNGSAFCSLKTLKGSYIYSNQGYVDGKPYASSGLMSFNGAGQVVLIVTRSTERTQQSTKGTYTVNGNCSGSMTLETKTVHNLYLSPNGDSFNFVRVSGDSVIGSEAKRVSRKLIVQQP